MHHDLWDLDPSAAPQLTTIRHNGRNRDVVAVASKTGWLYVFDRVTGEPIWPIEERPVPKSEMPGEAELADAAVSDQPAAVRRSRRSASTTSVRICRRPKPRRSRQRLLAANNKGLFTPISYADTVHIPTSNGGALFGGTAAEPRTGAVYVVAHDNPGILRLLRPGENAGRGGGGARMPPGRLLYQQNCQTCHGADRLGTDDGVPLVLRDRRSGEQHRRRRAALRCGRDPRRRRGRARAGCPRSRISAAPTSTTS